MESKDFKREFGNLAKSAGFKAAFGRWYKESTECIVVLELQKSNFGNYYQLLMKIFIQGAFGVHYAPDKELMKSSIGHVTINEPPKYTSVFDYDKQMVEGKRYMLLEELFENHIIPNTEMVMTKSGIRELATKGILYLLPAVKQELN